MIQLPAVFSSHMVLQRQKNISVWGDSDAESLKITLADKGIKFHADSLSPFALVSTEVEGTKNPVETSETTPKTGDSGLPIWIPVLMMAAASVTIMLLLYKRKAHRA